MPQNTTEAKILWDKNSKEILSIASCQNNAHNIGETLSYLKNKNATYGLFGMELTSHKELCKTTEGRLAWSKFFESL